MALVAGVDCSTQSTKVVVVDGDSGDAVAHGCAPHPVVDGPGGAHETDPAAWEESLAQALHATGRAGEVAAVAVAAQQHGLVVVDAAGTPLRPAVLWNDTRSAADARELVAAAGGPEAVARASGSVPSASFTITTWAWLRRSEPGVAAAAAGVRLPHDHLNAFLTGRASTDRSDASGTGWWDPFAGTYSEALLALPAVALDPGLLPPVRGPFEPAGAVGAPAAGRLGLREGTVVGAGAADNAAGALGLRLRPGEAAVSLGTSGTVFAVAERPSADPSGTVAGFASADGRFLPLACTLNATLAVDRTAAWLGLGREDVEPSATVAYLPWLDGERTPNVPDASGTITGLRQRTSRGAILQAAYEGVVATLLEAMALLGDAAPQDPGAPLVLLGGGARGRVWQETVRRLSGRPLLVPDVGEPVAYGAALQAEACRRGADAAGVARSWRPRSGSLLEAVGRDDEVVERVAAWRRTVLG